MSRAKSERGRVEAELAPDCDLICYQLEQDACEIVPGRSARPWMDATHQRHAYRCLPLSIANASGWEILAPFAFEAEWFGGDGVDSIEVRTGATPARIARFLTSHFGHGVLTFHTGHLFRTSPGWALWVRGAPNSPKDGICALDGLVETDWLPFPFTMNWRFTRPNAPVRFEEGEPICFVTPMPHITLDAIQPRLVDIADDPQLELSYQNWRDSRADFNERLREHDPGAVKEGWQRSYVRGSGEGVEAPPSHRSKRKLKSPTRARR